MTFRVERVSYAYPRHLADPNGKLALRDLSLVLPRGQITAVVGRSGVGKSTLLYLLGLLWEGRLQAGAIYYESARGGGGARDIQGLSPQERARIRRTEFGFLTQSASLLPNLTCLENVALPLALQGCAWNGALAAARKLLDVADELFEGDAEEHRLAELGTHWDREVSGGERKRLALLRAIIHDPDVLLADEPMSNLDQRSINSVVGLLRLWHAGELRRRLLRSEEFSALGKQTRDDGIPRTLIVVTHDTKSARRLATHFLEFQDDGTLGSSHDGTRPASEPADGRATLQR